MIMIMIIIIIINECQCGAYRLPRRLQGRCHAVVAIYTLKISDVRRQMIRCHPPLVTNCICKHTTGRQACGRYPQRAHF